MKKFILIGHKKRQGKDTVAKMLQKELGNAEIMSFADPIREILAELMGVTVEQLKTMYNDDSGLRNAMKTLGGGKLIEYFGKQVWKDLLVKRAEESDAEWIIISDFRFKREYIEGSYTINIIRNEGDGDTHQSEVELDDFNYNITIGNNCCLHNLNEKVVKVTGIIKNKFNTHPDTSNICLVKGEYRVLHETIEKYGEDFLTKLNLL